MAQEVGVEAAAVEVPTEPVGVAEKVGVRDAGVAPDGHVTRAHQVRFGVQQVGQAQVAQYRCRRGRQRLPRRRGTGPASVGQHDAPAPAPASARRPRPPGPPPHTTASNGSSIADVLTSGGVYRKRRALSESSNR